MKYKVYFFFLCIFFISPALASPVLTLQHEQIQPGETVLATITTPGEFPEQIEKSQIRFFKGRKETILESDIFFYNSTQYLYIYTTQEENITLRIENILYKEAGALQSTTLEQNLTIRENLFFDEETNETYTKILKVKPGFILAFGTSKLKFTNVGTMTLNFTFNDEAISLTSMSSQELEFTPQETFSMTKVSAYKDFLIPTLLIESQIKIPEEPLWAEPALKQSPELLVAETYVENETAEIIKLFNLQDVVLTDLKVSMPFDFLKIQDLSDMSAGETQNITLEFTPKIPGHFQGEINISYNQNGTEQLLQIPVSIFVLPKGVAEENFQVKEESCSDLSGSVCESGTICNGTAIFTKNAEYCCLASCVKTSSEESGSEEGGLGWLLALIIFAILGAVGYHFYKKQKQVSSASPEDSLKSITEKIERQNKAR